MIKELRQILPLLLRLPDLLDEEEKARVKDSYLKIGREKTEAELKSEKQTRPFASEVLSLCNCDPDYWGQVHDEYIERNTAIVDILNSIFTSFHKKGGKTLNVYENFGAVLSSGLTVGNFASGDVDFTVEASERQITVAALLENGFHEEIRIEHVVPSKNLVTNFYNPDALDGKGYWIQIMWKAVSRDFMLLQNRYVKRLSESRKSGLEQYKDTEIRILEPTAMVYFNALHFACEHHYSASPGMVLCCDMDRVIRMRNIDWDRMAMWAREDKAGLRIRLALDICRYFLKTEVPIIKFGESTKYYKMLWNRLVDETNYRLIPQNGIRARLLTELLSDDMSVIQSLITRLWRR